MIRRLPEELIRRLTAGEVIARPEDVVRELVENAIDAGASEISVEIQGGGFARVRVRDDGVGIPREELALALERHTTSKVTRLEEVRTLGFRGEALFALRTVARVRLTSRPKDQLGGATVVAEGERVEVFEHAAPAGTEVEVSRLFARMPKRKSALGPEAAEGRRALSRAERYLLHYPGLRFYLSLEGELRQSYPGGSFKDAVRAVWGNLAAERMVEVSHAEGEMRVEGVISRPELSRPRRDRLLLAVNGRPVAFSERLFKAVLEAYRELLAKGQVPMGVLNLTLPPEWVVPNADARKERVLLLEEERVAAFLERAVAEALAAHPLARPLPLKEERPEVHLPREAREVGFRLLGSFRDLYLLVERGDELLLIDQHAAHERVIFEELVARFEAEPPAELESPEIVALSPEEERGYLEREAELLELGLLLEPFGPGRWRVRAVPAPFLLAGEQLLALVRELVVAERPREVARRILGRLACLPAVRAGHRLSRERAEELVRALFATRTPWVCPHGRPTMLALSEAELARRFGRRSPRQEVTRPFGEVGEDVDRGKPKADGLAGEEGGVRRVKLK